MLIRRFVMGCVALCLMLLLPFTLIPGFAETSPSAKSQSATDGAQDPKLLGKEAPIIVPAYEIAPRDVAVGPNVLVNDRELCPNGRGLQQNETSITVAGDLVVVAFNDARGGRGACPTQHAAVGWGYSLDGGETFTDGGTLPRSTNFNNGDPWLGHSPDGQTIYLSGLWNSYAGLGFYRGRVDGATIVWDEPVVISFPTSGAFMDKEAFVVDDRTGTIYLTYTDFRSGGIRLTRSSDGGDTWASPVPVYAGGAQGSFPALNNQGHIFVAYSEGPNRAISVARSMNGGATFQRVASFPVRTAGVSGMDRSPSFPQIAVDLSGGPRDGWAYVTWHGLDSRNVLRPFVAHSGDGGDSWSDPVAVNSDDTNAPHWWPSISVDDNGNVNVIFFDRRNNPGTARTDLYFAQSSDGGETFTDVRVTDVAGDWRMIRYDPGFTYAGDYIRAVSYGTSVYATWADVRYGDPDIFFSRIDAAAVAARRQN